MPLPATVHGKKPKFVFMSTVRDVSLPATSQPIDAHFPQVAPTINKPLLNRPSNLLNIKATPISEWRHIKESFLRLQFDLHANLNAYS